MIAILLADNHLSEAHRFRAMKKLGLRNQMGLLRYFEEEEKFDNAGQQGGASLLE